MSNEALANLVSLTHFMNSFLRDYWSDDRVSFKEDVILTLEEGKLFIPIIKRSLLGSHKYEGKIFLNENEISFLIFSQLILKNFNLSSDENNFTQKVINSRDNLLEILNFDRRKWGCSYLDSEQELLYGHPFHPYPKAKWGMSHSELKQYAPEFSSKFNILWISIESTIFTSNISLDEYRRKISSLLKFDNIKIVENEIYVPMHPWQWEKIRNKLDLTMVNKVFRGENFFYPLSSMRTLYNDKSPFQIKFSMDVTLTNSVRHLQMEECYRGVQIEKIFRQENIVSLIKNFSIQCEPFFVSLLGKDGTKLNETIVQFRENSKMVKKTILLSSLCESKLELNDRLERKKWLGKFLKNILKPFFELQIKHGILLGAHMQNILVELDGNDYPESVIYRDCQGSGFSQKGVQLYLKYFPNIEKAKNILAEDDVNKVFGYYIIVNTLFSVISAIARSESKIELELLADVRTFFYDLMFENSKNKDADLNFIQYLLTSKVLYQKGNMRCSLSCINENTVDQPWSIYNEIINPLQKLRAIDCHENGILYQVTTKRNKILSFRIIEMSDLDVFFRWHHKDFVSEFWELNVSREKLKYYIESVKFCSYKLPLILEIDGSPAGYFEAYWAFEDRIAPYCNADVYDRGIHLLFGEEKYLNTSIVLEAIYHVSKFLFEKNPKTQKIWGEPRSDNKKILAIADKLPGWKCLHEFDFPHKKAMLLECDKKRFYKECNEIYS